jgi:hypothetical protein
LNSTPLFSKNPCYGVRAKKNNYILGAEMAFTTWTALKTQILDDIAGGSILTRSYSIGSRSRFFQTIPEVIEFLKFCDYQIACETTPRRGPTLRGATPT